MVKTSLESSPPQWSPDGRTIAVAQGSYSRIAGWELFLMDARGGHRRRLTKNGVGDLNPAWSPDGSELVFQRKKNGRPGDLYVIDLATGHVAQLTRTPSVDEDLPAWSPDGRLIAFVHRAEPSDSIWVMRRDGRGRERIADGSAPRWAPDARRIAYETVSESIQIVDIGAPSHPRTLVHRADANSPAWSPDGRFIAFAALAEPIRSLSEDDIYTIPVSGGAATPWRADGGYYLASSPDWQPRCTRYGTARRDILRGTGRDDVICGLGGNDVIYGGGGNDILIGGPGNDTLSGGSGSDRVFGSEGSDTLYARDGARDIVAGGPGRDRARADPTDDVTSAAQTR